MTGGWQVWSPLYLSIFCGYALYIKEECSHCDVTLWFVALTFGSMWRWRLFTPLSALTCDSKQPRFWQLIKTRPCNWENHCLPGDSSESLHILQPMGCPEIEHIALSKHISPGGGGPVSKQSQFSWDWLQLGCQLVASQIFCTRL